MRPCQSTNRLLHAFLVILACFLVTSCVNLPVEQDNVEAVETQPIEEEPNVDQIYTVRKASSAPGLDGQWASAVWSKADTFTVGLFHERSSDHHPKVRGKMLHSDEGVHVFFKVNDRYVIGKFAEYQDPVCRDSCVEFFVQPKPDKGYLNFEVSCSGTLLLEYHERDENGNDVMVSVPAEVAEGIRIHHSMPDRVFPEIAEETEWTVEYFVPFSVFEEYVGPLGPVEGTAWRANFYKCADESSHPHWGMWASVGETLSFHQPQFFGTIQFTGESS